MKNVQGHNPGVGTYTPSGRCRVGMPLPGLQKWSIVLPTEQIDFVKFSEHNLF